MSESSPIVRSLVREALEHEGRVSVGRFVQEIVPVDTLREIARRHALSPKGYRIEKANAARLVPLLVDPRRPDVVEEVIETLFVQIKSPRPASKEADAAPADRIAELVARLELRDRQFEAAKAELGRCRAQATRQREREAELVSKLEAAESRVAASRAESEMLRREASMRPVRGDSDPGSERRIHDLERDQEGLVVEGEQLRHMVALRQAQIRELEEQVNELRELVPVGKRRKRERPAAPLLADHFRLPHFLPSFYKSLIGRERRHIERSIQAVLLFCTEGPSYPGLEVKQIEGQVLWSMRASLKLRVYFELRGDKDVDLIAVADREDQHTTLRRLKER